MAITTARIRADGKLVRVRPGRAETPMAPPAPLRPATDAEIRAAAKSDPDARPWTEAGVAGARKISPARNIRRILGLTQEEFAARFHIPVGTLRDWEQGRSEPD